MDFFIQMFKGLDTPESLFALLIFLLAVILAYIFINIFVERKVKEALSKLEREQITVSTLKADNEELQSDIKVKLAEINEHKLGEEEAKSKNYALLEQKDQLESQIAMLYEAEAILKDKLDEANSRHAIMENSHRNMSNNFKNISLQFETSMAQKDALHSKIQELEAANQELLNARTTENATFITQMNSVKNSLYSLQVEHTIIKNELSSKTKENSQLKSEMLVLKTATKHFDKEKEKLQEELENQSVAKAKMEDEFRAFLAKYNEASFKIEIMEDELETLRKIKENVQNQESELTVAFNTQINDLQQTLTDTTNKVAALESKKVDQVQEIEKLKTQLEAAKLLPNEALVALKKQLEEERQDKIAKKQEADRLRATMITLQADLAKSEEDRELEQEYFLKELTELKANHQEILELEATKLISLQNRMAGWENEIINDTTHQEKLAVNTGKIKTLEAELEVLEAKITVLEAAANDAINDSIEIEVKYNQILEQESEKLATAKDKTMALEAKVEALEAQLTLSEATTNNATNETIAVETKYNRILEEESQKLATAQGKMLALELQVETLEANITRLEATFNDAENDAIEIEERYKKIIEQESEKFAAAQEKALHFEIQVETLEAQVTRLETTANNAKNELVEYEARMEKIIELENNKLVAANEVNLALQREINDLKKNMANISNVTNNVSSPIETNENPNNSKPNNIMMTTDNEDLTVSQARVAIQQLIGNTIPAATVSEKDDLKVIRGIGTFLEKKLNALGIYTYNQVASFDQNTIEKLTIAIEFFPERIERDQWVKQAKELI